LIKNPHEVLRTYEGGKTCEEIAAEWEVSNETIRRLLLRHKPEIIRRRGFRKKDPLACTTLLTLEEEKKIVDYYCNGKSLDEIEKLIGVSDSTVCKIIRHFAPYLIRAPVLPPKPIKPQPLVLSPEKAFLIGHLIGDGSVMRKSYAIRYTNTCLKLVLDVSKAFTSVYGLEGRITQRDGIINIDWCSKEAWKDLHSYTNYHCREWRVPTQIFEYPKVLGPPFLRALFDDDGCVALCSSRKHENWQRWVCLRSICTYGCEDIARLLSLFEIRSRKAYKAVIISGKENIKRFQSMVSFTTGVKVRRGLWKGIDKAEVLELLLASYENPLLPRLKITELAGLNAGFSPSSHPAAYTVP
jgi:transposase